MSYREQLKSLSDELLALQKPILILDSIKWPYQIKLDFLAQGGTQLPAISDDYYQQLPLSFDPSSTQAALSDLQSRIRSKLGAGDPLGLILQQNTDQYRLVVDMLQQRGEPGFMHSSQALYGSASDHLRGDKKTLIELGERLCHIFSLPAARKLNVAYPKTITAPEAVTHLRDKLQPYFPAGSIKVALSDGIVSDASAGGDTIKINSQAKFSSLDLQVLEVHEGWVHLGTTLNGRNQPWATWLSVGSPRITAIQEGLAVLIETLTFSSFPNRARRISDRVVAIDMAERGANFMEVYRHFLGKGLSESDAYTVAQRTFRGGMVGGGSCFTKDLSYIRGFVETVNFIKTAILSDVPQILPFLFSGKVTLDDIPVLYQYHQEGVIAAPQFLPPMFRDLNGLYVWFGFASGLSLIDLDTIQQHFQELFVALGDSDRAPNVG
ncbi:MAG: hypothetical protein ACI89D_001359 [Bermanella sp.]